MPRPSARPPTLRLGVATTSVPAQPNSVLWLAQDDGFYRRQGVDVDLQTLNGTPLVLTALLSGNVDVGNVSTDSVIRLATTRQAPVMAISSPDPGSYYLLVARREVKSVADLRGKTVGISTLGGLDEEPRLTTRRGSIVLTGSSPR